MTAAAGLPPDESTGRTTVSLLRTFVGSHLRRLGGWIAVADLVELMGHAGSTGTVTRSALSRVKAKGLLVPERVGGRSGYRLAPAAHRTLDRGDQRIYGYRPMRLDDPWMLVVFSVPEQDRQLRHRLRTELTWLGCGVVAPGTWIGPGHLLREARDVLGGHGLLPYVTLFTASAPVTHGPLPDAVQTWWDLDDLATRYERLIVAHEPVAARWREAHGTDARAFADHLRLVDDWRSIPYLDPGLPAALLPPDWPGGEGLRLFGELHQALDAAATRHVRAVAGEGRRP